MLRLQGFKGDFFSIGKKFKGKFKAVFLFFTMRKFKVFWNAKLQDIYSVGGKKIIAIFKGKNLSLFCFSICKKIPADGLGRGGKHPGRCLAQGSWIKTQVWSPKSRREGLRPPPGSYEHRERLNFFDLVKALEDLERRGGQSQSCARGFGPVPAAPHPAPPALGGHICLRWGIWGKSVRKRGFWAVQIWIHLPVHRSFKGDRAKLQPPSTINIINVVIVKFQSWHSSFEAHGAGLMPWGLVPEHLFPLWSLDFPRNPQHPLAQDLFLPKKSCWRRRRDEKSGFSQLLGMHRVVETVESFIDATCIINQLYYE